MDSMSRSPTDSLRLHLPLAGRLRRKWEQWLGSGRARRADGKQWGLLAFSRGWAVCSDAAVGFAARRVARWARLPVLLWGELSYPWLPLSMAFLFPLTERLAPLGAVRRGGQGLAPTGAERRDAPRTPTLPIQGLGEEKPLPFRAAFGLWQDAASSRQFYPSFHWRIRSVVRPGLTGEREQRPARAREGGLVSPDGLVERPRLPADSFALRVSLEERPSSLPHTVYRQAGPRHGAPAQPAWPSPLVLSPTSGVPLEPALRSRLEKAMGRDLGGVRLHTDSAAASLAFRLRAHAFTVGPHLFFAAGRFRPQTRAGLALLAHELAHVGQQPAGVPVQWGQLTFGQHRALERQAHTQAQAVLAGMGLPALGDLQARLGPASMGSAGRSGPVGERAGPSLPVNAPGGGRGAFAPLMLSWASRTMTVVPLRQEATAQPEATAPVAGPSPGAVSTPPGEAEGGPPGAAPDPEQLAQQIYEWIQRRQRIERERRGIQRWL
jgi:hypothetical protein